MNGLVRTSHHHVQSSHDILYIIVSDYGEENPLFYDYYGFQPEMYRLKFKSRGDSVVSQRVVELFKEVYFLSISALVSWLISRSQDYWLGLRLS